ncbi:MAG: hypothetical protein JNK82_25120 [Myxococcaceae bacterium]|nr:hypothetical protein [Myxococcaceae bacterium]
MRRGLLLVALVLAACATTGQAERIAALSPYASELYARYAQFMTEAQRDTFLRAASDAERHAQVEGLKIDEMLADFPKPVQEAIWAQQILPGMSPAAVLLSWGSPWQREIDETPLRKEAIERWYYQRNGKSANVTFTNGVVSEYDDGQR